MGYGCDDEENSLNWWGEFDVNGKTSAYSSVLTDRQILTRIFLLGTVMKGSLHLCTDFCLVQWCQIWEIWQYCLSSLCVFWKNLGILGHREVHHARVNSWSINQWSNQRYPHSLLEIKNTGVHLFRFNRLINKVALKLPTSDFTAHKIFPHGILANRRLLTAYRICPTTVLLFACFEFHPENCKAVEQWLQTLSQNGGQVIGKPTMFTSVVQTLW